LTKSSPWLNWLGDKLGSSKAPNISGLHMETQPGQNYEFGIGVDYSSRLFFTMTHAEHDVEWIQFNDTDALSTLQAHHDIPHPKPIVMPLDLQRAKSPFYKRPAVDGTVESAQEDVPDLPDALTYDWSNLPLAVNVHSRKVSPVIHFDGEKRYVDTWWPRMWYHPWARALLQKNIEEPTQLLSKDRTAFLTGAKPESFWNTAGGAGGAWTHDGNWMSWNDLCQAYEGEIFA